MKIPASPRSFTTTDSVRLAQILLLAAVALFFTLVVFNNLTDFDSNYQFIHHVLAMDTTFPANHGLWRALHAPAIYTIFYISIILWEALNVVLCWSAVAALTRTRNAPATAFHAAKRLGVLALTAGLLLWLVAFLDVGGEWFLMWQSKTWNGQEEAFRMFAVEALVLALLLLPESGPKPLL